MATILIEGIEIYAHHGYYKEEQKLGSRFRIDLSIEADTTEAEKSDALDKTVNYQAVHEVLFEEMQKKSKLLEHIASRILDVIMEKFPSVKEVSIKLSKLHPPIPGNVEKVSVVLERKRE